MLLTLLGFGMVITFMTLIMTKRLSPLVALILVPILFALMGASAPASTKMMLDGIRKIAPTGVMLMFAILYFGVMIDAGLFDPIVGRILRAVKGDPLKIVVGTTVLALVISLDGDGSTTMIVVASMLPLYRRLKMNPLSMTCLAMLASGIMNLTPWGGPTARAASALHVDVGDIFVPLVPVMGVAIVALLALAFALGLKERRRLGALSLPDGATHAGYDEDGPKNLPDRGRPGPAPPAPAVGQRRPDAGADGQPGHGRAAAAGAVHDRLRHRADHQLPGPGRAAPRGANARAMCCRWCR